MAGRGHEGSGGVPKSQEGLVGPGDVGRPSWRIGWGREVLQEGREGLGGPPEEPGGVGRAERGREALPEGWRGRESFQDVQEDWEALQ